MINWHAYQDEVCLLDGTTLITGQNGTGKTTVQDAIQYALVADQTKVRFNKANEGSKRNLLGYCRWKTTATEASKGGSRYERQACTTYVALQFSDDDEPENDFVCGVAIDSSEIGVGQQVHFLVAHANVWELPCLNERNEPLSVSDFKDVMRSRSCPVILEATKYRKDLRHRLGKLPESFHQFLVKALDFKPLGKVRQFIFEFLLEERNLETDALVRNVENYRRLCNEAEEASQRIEAIEDLLHKFTSFSAAEDKLARLDYIVTRGRIDVLRDRLREKLALADWCREQSLAKANEVAECKSNLQSLTADRDRVVKQLAGMPVNQVLDEIKTEHQRLEGDLKRLRSGKEEAEQILDQMQELFEFLTGEAVEMARRLFPEQFANDPFADQEQRARLRAFLANALEPDGRRLKSWQAAVEDGMRIFLAASNYADKTRLEIQKTSDDLRTELKHLELGKVTYRPDVEALLHLFNSRLQPIEPIKPLCEYLEVADERWSNVIESMLGENRFTLVIPPELYDRCLSLYDKYKDAYQLPGRGKVRLERTGILDVTGVLRDVKNGRGAHENSLARKIETDHSYSRSYVDYLLGNLMCEFDPHQLRQHKRAVTPEGMLHQQHRTSRIAQESYTRHYLGRASHARRIAEIQHELVCLQESASKHLELKSLSDLAVERVNANFANLRTFKNLCEQLESLPRTERRLQDLEKKKNQLERDPELARLNQQKQMLDDAIDKTRQQSEDAARQEGEFSEQAKNAEKDADDCTSKLDEKALELDDRCKLIDVEKVQSFSNKYHHLLSDLSAPQIIEKYEKQRGAKENKVKDERKILLNAQSSFEQQYGVQRPEDERDQEPYLREITKWRDSKLPQFREQIETAKQDARRQLAEDYLYRLYDSFEFMDEQLTDMNRALRVEAANAGWGKYQFTHHALIQHKSLYELIKAVGQSGSSALPEIEALKTNAAEELDRLANALLSSSPEQIDQYVLTDYREFFDFDLVLKREDGRDVHFNDVTEEGSGGENQLPYYIAIFSAMYQMYRQKRDGKPGCGVVLLDEAFSKMDETRIDSALGLARHLGLQLIMITPGDKVATIVPRVETTLLIQRDQRASKSIPVIQRFHKEMLQDVLEQLEELAEPTAASA
jgi:uncharacterized protein YPO0396